MRDSHDSAASASRPFSIDVILGAVPALLVAAIDAARPIPATRELLRLVVKNYIAASLADELVDTQIQKLIALGMLTTEGNGRLIRMAGR